MKKDFVGCFNHILHLINVNRFLDIKIVKKAMENQTVDQESEFESDSDDSQNESVSDDLFDVEEDEVYFGFDDEFYESKQYSEDELECLKSIKLVIKKIKKLVSAFNQSNFLNHQLIET